MNEYFNLCQKSIRRSLGSAENYLMLSKFNNKREFKKILCYIVNFSKHS